jgi:predicted O-methyltransferase YrrM
VFAWSVRRLPPRVAWFQLRARLVARRAGDDFSLASATRPDKLALLLRSAAGCHHAVELGTGTGWTSISLLLADPHRELATYDTDDRAHREDYLRLAGGQVRARLQFVHAPGSAGPTRPDQAVDFLFIDSSHSAEATAEEFAIWRSTLADGAVVVFDDADNPGYPGVRVAIDGLGLSGEYEQGLFLHRVRAAASPAL